MEADGGEISKKKRNRKRKFKNEVLEGSKKQKQDKKNEMISTKEVDEASEFQEAAEPQGTDFEEEKPKPRIIQQEKVEVSRDVRRLINKASVPNLESIVSDCCQLYETKTRGEMNQQITQCILDISESIITTSIALAQSALVAIMHSVVGPEVGSYFVEKLVQRCTKHYEENNSQSFKNLLAIAMHLYNFQVVQCVFIYDLITQLLERFTELDIDLLLVLLKVCGPQLRSDDPSSLKEIVLLVKSQAATRGIKMQEEEDKESKLEVDSNKNAPASLRAKFMVQTILDLKNNKLKASDSSESNHVKKAIKNLLNKRGAMENPLRVPWRDFANADQNGRWWLVGSSWSTPSTLAKPHGADAMMDTKGGTEEAKILQLAKTERMNTDIRRAVFCVIIGSQDFLDAFEKLLKLNLKSKQDREIVNVLLHCCGQEAKFNEYYVHLAVKLCGYNRNFKFSFQTAYWDKFKSMDTYPAPTILNLAYLLAALVANSALSLSVLKAADFNNLNSHQVLFFRLFFTALFTKYPEEDVNLLFEKFVNNQTKQEESNAIQLNTMKEGICYFFLQEKHHFKNSKAKLSETVQAQRELFQKRAKTITKLLEKSIDPTLAALEF